MMHYNSTEGTFEERHCKDIGGNGVVGQIIVFAPPGIGRERKMKISGYEPPTFFVITNKTEDYYVLRDSTGSEARVH